MSTIAITTPRISMVTISMVTDGMACTVGALSQQVQHRIVYQFCTKLAERSLEKDPELQPQYESWHRTPPWPRLHKYYFATPSNNQQEQFSYFVNLVAWLFKLIGRSFTFAEGVDDICTIISGQLREIGFPAPNWPAAKLKQGYGDAVSTILDGLTSMALEVQKFEFDLPNYNDCGSWEIEEILNETTSELFVPETLENKDPVAHLNMEATDRICLPNSHGAANDWKLELERVAPLLRISVVPDGKDWRTHLDQAQELQGEVTRSLIKSNNELERVETGIAAALEKIQCREKYINLQLEPLAIEYNAAKGRLNEIQQRYKGNQERIKELSNEIIHISEKIEQVKQMTVEKGNTISDVSPLMQIKSSIQNLKVELREMEVRIGVLQHTLLQVSVNQSRRGHELGFLQLATCK